MRRDADGKYILIDFGASKEFQKTVATKGTIIGTFGYSPIEQFMQGEAYQASDLFSLGVTCFYLLTKVDPHELYINDGYRWIETWQQSLKQPISQQFQEILAKLLQKDRRNRYQSATEVIEALRAIAAYVPSFSQPTTIQSPSPPPEMAHNLHPYVPLPKGINLQTFSFETAQISFHGFFGKRETITRETKQAQPCCQCFPRSKSVIFL